MKPYRTLATIRFFSGNIGLTNTQARKRMNYLSKIKGNVYEISREVAFKAGEVIGLEYAPKPYRKLLECLEPEKAPEMLEPPEHPEENVKDTKPAEPKKKRTYKRRK